MNKFFLGLHALTIAAISFLGFVVLTRQSAEKIAYQQPPSAIKNEAPASEVSPQDLQGLRDYVDEQLLNLQPIEKIVTEKVIEKTVVSEDKKQTSYIPLGTSYETRSTDWVTVPDSGVYIDLDNDFSSSSYVTWEASLKADNGGEIEARLWDDTNKIAVNSSSLKTSSNEYLRVYSGQLAFWRGNNLYKVQIKSKDSKQVSVSGAKIKIVVK